MTARRILSLATSAIFLMGTNGAHATDSGAATNKAVRVDCTAAMNDARDLVGFTGLTLEKKLPVESSPAARVTPESTYLEAVCAALKDEQGAAPAESGEIDGTYAYAIQDGTEANCNAAVEQWKEAFSNFSALPPTYSESEDQYKNPQNVSFISLFNPNENPKVDCAYVTCPAKQEPAQPGDGGLEEEGEEEEEKGEEQKHPEKKSRSATTSDTEVKALVCVTTPNALKTGNAPYTQSQWDQITTGFNKNAASAVPAFLGFASAAVGFLFI